jgi:hypothetical protein
VGSRIFARSVIKGETTVIGRVKDLQNLKQSEKSLLDRLPDQGDPKANGQCLLDGGAYTLGLASLVTDMIADPK